MMGVITASDAASIGYDSLAPFYDQFTIGYAHEPWIAAIEHRASALGLDGTRALDIACGTGNSTVPLISRGYSVTGCDISPKMIQEARRKLPAHAESFLVADMRELPALGQFDLVLCVDDGVNYLLSDTELEDTFAGVARLLSPRGVFAFDVNSLLTYRTSFAETFVTETEGRFFAWRGEASSGVQAGELASASVEIFAERDSGLWERHWVRTVQRHHPHEAIDAALGAAGLSCCATLGQHPGAVLEDSADESRHIKFVYFARRNN